MRNAGARSEVLTGPTPHVTSQPGQQRAGGDVEALGPAGVAYRWLSASGGILSLYGLQIGAACLTAELEGCVGV